MVSLADSGEPQHILRHQRLVQALRVYSLKAVYPIRAVDPLKAVALVRCRPSARGRLFQHHDDQ